MLYLPSRRSAIIDMANESVSLVIICTKQYIFHCVIIVSPNLIMLLKWVASTELFPKSGKCDPSVGGGSPGFAELIWLSFSCPWHREGWGLQFDALASNACCSAASSGNTKGGSASACPCAPRPPQCSRHANAGVGAVKQTQRQAPATKRP